MGIKCGIIHCGNKDCKKDKTWSSNDNRENCNLFDGCNDFVLVVSDKKEYAKIMVTKSN